MGLLSLSLTISRRYCRIGECEGKTEQAGETCSGLPPCEKNCVDFDLLGTNYDGNVAVDYRGRECLSWQDTTVGKQYRDEYAGSGNYCRNRHSEAPWVFCYVDTLGVHEKSQCDVPLCKPPPDGLVFTVEDRVCQFPFKDSRGAIRHSCIPSTISEIGVECFAGKMKRGIRQLEG